VNTKLIFANALIELLTIKSIDRIKVVEIVKLSELSKGSFYAHFQDKYALSNWIFHHFSEVASFPLLESGQSFFESMPAFFNYIEPRRQMLRNAIRSSDINSMQNYWKDFCREFFSKVLILRGVVTESTDRDLLFEMYSDATNGAFARWITGELVCSPEKLADLCMRACPPELLEYLR
jgi:AcrR family transcriptional regulator